MIADSKGTFWFGYDSMGNTPHAVTVEGTCIRDIYGQPGAQFYNQATRQVGDVQLGSDKQLHFTPIEGR